MDQATDQDVQRLLDGGRRREAFECLIEHYQHKVFRLCFSILGDEAAAEDAAQDTFLKAWRGLPGFRGDAALPTWLYSIARNTCLTRSQRGAGRAEELLTEGTAASRLIPIDDSLDVRAAIARLPGRYRQALLLFYFEGKSYEEVSAMLDLPLGTVKTYLHRARKELAASFRQSATEVKHGV